MNKIVSRIVIIFSVCIAFVGSASASEPMHVAVGAGSLFLYRESVGNQNFVQFAPEFVGYLYHPFYKDFSIRSGLRTSFSWNQPEMPQSIKIREYDFRLGGEIGLVWDRVVVPSFSIGSGMIFRRTQFDTSSNIAVEKDQISGNSFLPFLQIQSGLGIPIAKGKVVAEPYLRYLYIFGDSRSHWASGVEATLSLF